MASPTTPPSCLPGNPLITWGTPNAPILNYNLPQSSCLEIKAYIPIQVPESYFKPGTFVKPAGNFWEIIKEYSNAEAINMLAGSMVIAPSGILTATTAEKQRSFSHDEGRLNVRSGTVGNKLDVNSGLGGNKLDVNVGNGGKLDIMAHDGCEKLDVHLPAGCLPVMAQQISLGYRPYIKRNLYGRNLVHYQPEPVDPQPQIVIVFHTEVCSYAGDYGAGKTIRTFTLLPGEKTEISIRTFKHQETVKHKSENVVDSFSEYSANDLESRIEQETSSSSTYGTEQNKTKSSGFELGGGVSIGAGGANSFNIGGSGGVNNTNSSTLSSTLQYVTDTLDAVIDRQVAESTAVREIAVNTDVTETLTTEEETSTLRRLENINYSRVLNFVFRQLLQEYISITYIKDVSILYTNGYNETKRFVKLDGLQGLLNEVILDATKVAEVKTAILNELNNIIDYTGTPVSFTEQITETITGGCGDTSTHDITYCRRKRGLSQTYTSGSTAITVPGIILGAKHRIMPTDSVVTDALLGQGEALDCYNQKLQEAATEKALMEIKEMAVNLAIKEQAIAIIDLITDPAQKAELYKKVFGTCCDTPQTQVIS